METTVASRNASFHSFSIPIHTQYARQFVDLTETILDRVRASGVTNGMVVVSSQHTTASVVVNEHEPELLKDLDVFLRGLAPEENEYAHNSAPCEPGEHPNGHAHCQALMLNSSASFPIVDGQPALGRYQRVFLVELDRSRPRKVLVTLLGL